jgi:hypothetical protein
MTPQLCKMDSVGIQGRVETTAEGKKKIKKLALGRFQNRIEMNTLKNRQLLTKVKWFG